MEPLLTPGKRRIFIALMGLTPLLFFAVLELGLRIGGFGGRYPLFVPAPAAPDYLVLNSEMARRYFTQQVRVPTGLHDVFAAQKDSSTVRIFVQGASSAAGYPYYYGGSFSRMLEQRLQQTYPERRVEVINTAVAAVNSYALLDQSHEILAHAPDAVLIYAGHNEFYGALGVASAESLGRSRWAVNLYLALQKFRVVQALRAVLGHVAGIFGSPAETAANATLMERMVGEQTIPYGSALYAQGLRQFRGNLRALLSRYQARGVPVFIGTVASNERAHAPFESTLSPSADEMAWVEGMREAMQRARQRDPDGALRAIDAVIALDTLSASAYWTRARILDAAGRFPEARKAYLAAKDRDQLRFRASEDGNAIIREEASRAGAFLVDAQAALAAQARDGIIGSDMMLEHLHPNVEGYFILADAFYEALEAEGLVEVSSAYIPRGVARSEVLFTTVDSLYGAYRLQQLLGSWPFQDPGVVLNVMDTVQARSRAEEIALELYRGNSSWYEATAELRAHYAAEGRWHSALQAGLAIIQQYPYLPRPYAEAGDILVRQGRLGEALTYFEAANDLEESSRVHLMIGGIHLAARRAAPAIRHLERAALLEPQSPPMLFQLSQAHLLGGNVGKAKETLERLLAVAPDHPQGLRLVEALRAQE